MPLRSEKPASQERDALKSHAMPAYFATCKALWTTKISDTLTPNSR